MTDLSRARYDFSVTGGGAAFLALVCVAAGVSLAALGLSARARFGADGNPPVDRTRVCAATEKIDPNTAPVCSLRRLPGIGPHRAAAIVRYRTGRGRPQFRSAEDLAVVNGIGPSTARRMRPYLPARMVK